MSQRNRATLHKNEQLSERRAVYLWQRIASYLDLWRVFPVDKVLRRPWRYFSSLLSNCRPYRPILFVNFSLLYACTVLVVVYVWHPWISHCVWRLRSRRLKNKDKTRTYVELWSEDKDKAGQRLGVQGQRQRLEYLRGQELFSRTTTLGLGFTSHDRIIQTIASLTIGGKQNLGDGRGSSDPFDSHC